MSPSKPKPKSKEKMKVRWKKFKKYFGKMRMNSISEFEYFLIGSLIRVSSKVKIEEVIMNKNIIRFILAYSLLPLQSPLLEKISLKTESDFSAQIISGTLSLDGEDDL